jgi:alkylhydroperoxidase/carboxymuconolactone decarboxylase family protein YurZ
MQTRCRLRPRNQNRVSIKFHNFSPVFIIIQENMQSSDYMTETPLKIYEKLDPDLLKHIENSRDFVFADGALPRKFKLLIAMAFDASYGAVNGVKSLAQQALEAGATKEEIAESVRVAQYLSGVGSVYTAAQGLKDLLDPDRE